MNNLKKRALALGMAAMMLSSAGCTNNNNNENEVPSRVSISSDLNNFDEFSKFIMQNGEPIKVYNSQNVYLCYDKETYEVTEYIYNAPISYFGGGEIYDLQTEELLIYSNGISSYNMEYHAYILENNYQVCLADIGDYIEGYTVKEYYSLDEIRELEPQILESLKLINSAKVKTK